MCDHQKSLEYYFKALRIWEQEARTEDIEGVVSLAYNNIGAEYAELGDYLKALEYCDKALKMQIRYLGTDNYETAITYNNLAYLHEKRGEYERALEYYF